MFREKSRPTVPELKQRLRPFRNIPGDLGLVVVHCATGYGDFGLPIETQWSSQDPVVGRLGRPAVHLPFTFPSNADIPSSRNAANRSLQHCDWRAIQKMGKWAAKFSFFLPGLQNTTCSCWPILDNNRHSETGLKTSSRPAGLASFSVVKLCSSSFPTLIRILAGFIGERPITVSSDPSTSPPFFTLNIFNLLFHLVKMPFWDTKAERGVFGQDPDTSAIQLNNGKESTPWSFPDPLVPSVQPSKNQFKLPGDCSLADYSDLTKALDDFTFDAPESPPSSSDDDSSSDHDSSPSLPDLSLNRSFTLLTLDNTSNSTLTTIARPWEQYLPKTAPAHLRAFRLNGRRPKSTRPQQQRGEPPKLLLTQEPQLLEPIETSCGLSITYNDSSFLLPSPLSPCVPKNFPRAPQNSPDSAYFPSESPTATSAPIPIPTSKINKTKEDQPAMEPEPVIFTATCRRTPYYPPNSSQTEDRSRVYMNRGPHYIANWTPLSSLPIEAQKRIERSMVKFTAPEGKEDDSSESST